MLIDDIIAKHFPHGHIAGQHTWSPLETTLQYVANYKLETSLGQALLDADLSEFAITIDNNIPIDLAYLVQCCNDFRTQLNFCYNQRLGQASSSDMVRGCGTVILLPANHGDIPTSVVNLQAQFTHEDVLIKMHFFSYPDDVREIVARTPKPPEVPHD